ncbi:MAG: hypothetical protein AOA66_0380 [Candidatus Bathyarchaeota archaeon BA2]|nr:MAG: hypothetical protein AOA66_0380 [Candidatus Bathyarchaeota archaeon BA2]
MPGRLWKLEEEQLFRSLWESGVHDVKLLAQKIRRSEGVIREKLKRMGLRVVVEKSAKQTTTRGLIPGDLLTHEERAMKMGIVTKIKEELLAVVRAMPLISKS